MPGGPARSRGASGDDGATGRPGWQRVALAVAAVVVVVGGLSAMPLRGLLSQRGSIDEVEAELAEVRTANERLERRLTVLDDPAEIQRIARREYGLVDEGEESYSILPPATAGVVLPNAWPFDVLADSVAAASSGGAGG